MRVKAALPRPAPLAGTGGCKEASLSGFWPRRQAALAGRELGPGPFPMEPLSCADPSVAPADPHITGRWGRGRGGAEGAGQARESPSLGPGSALLCFESDLAGPLSLCARGRAGPADPQGAVQPGSCLSDGNIRTRGRGRGGQWVGVPEIGSPRLAPRAARLRPLWPHSRGSAQRLLTLQRAVGKRPERVCKALPSSRGGSAPPRRLSPWAELAKMLLILS